MPLVKIARALRKRPTRAEFILWRHLQDRQLEGAKFRRQQPLGKYVVDFACLEKKIVVEADGGQHSEIDRDMERDNWLRSQGFKVLRFWNNEILTNIRGVLTVIEEF